MESKEPQTLRLVAGWAVVSAVLMAIGAFGPWVTLLGTFTARGTDDGAGWTVVGAAVVAAVALGFLLRSRRRWLCLIPLLAGLLGVAITAYNLHEVWTDSDVLFGSRLEEAAWGIYVALVGSGSLVLAALAAASRLPGGSAGNLVEIRASETSAKIRAPWLVFVLSIVTFGLYYLYWYYQVNRELKDFGVGRHPLVSLLAVVPGALLIVPPFVSWWRFLGRLREAEERAGSPERIDHALGIALYVIGIFLLPFELIYTQYHLNTLWHTAGAATGGNVRPTRSLENYAPEPWSAPDASA